MLSSFSLASEDLPPNLHCLRQEVRSFLEEERTAGSYVRHAAGWDRFDPAFTRKVAARGWIGMTWPRRYGGHERTSLERYVVTEELLAAGAPVRAHWVADRQTGPLLLAVGSEKQKLHYLPRIASGQCYICVGMSEPDSGSDLASIRTKAVKVEGGWRIDGRKVWISNAHVVHIVNVFARTSPRNENDRHAGVTQFLVDLKSPGITRKPIINLAGEHEFNEVVFDSTFVPDDGVIGQVGNAWKQASGELAHERSGADRWLNAYNLLVRLVERVGNDPAPQAAERIGRLIAHIWTLHRMSFSVAGMLNRGATPDVEAALVKDLGNQFDYDVPEAARLAVTEEVRAALPADDKFSETLARAMLYAPSYTLRGGTREILRGIIAKGLGLR